MQAIEFVVRDGAGNVSHGMFGDDGVGARLNVGDGQQISLHLGQEDVQGYIREGDDLVVTLADGSTIRLANYFVGDNALYVSEHGELFAVDLSQGDDSDLYALYHPEASWGKWSPSDDLIYFDEPEVMAAQFDTGLMGLGGIGSGGGLAAVAGGGALIGGLGGGGGDGGGPVYEVTVDPGNWVLGGDDDPDPGFPVTGTGVPGEDVSVTAGDVTQVVTVGDNGHWEAVFTGDTLPEDGDYVVAVTTGDQGGEEVALTGPTVLIDTVAPDVSFTAGVASTGDFFNGEGHADGVVVAGTSEPGATLTVTCGGVSTELVVGESGTWEVQFGPDAAPQGEYEAEISVRAVDAIGNSATYGDVLVVDTLGFVEFSGRPVTADDVVNAVEAGQPIAMTGTTLPGSEVIVTVNGQNYGAVVDAGGNWVVTLPPSSFPPGEYEMNVSASAVSPAGNNSNTATTVEVDTQGWVTLSDAPVTADDVVNAAEAAGGVTLSGMTQPGSTVMVQLGSASAAAVVAADGSWSASFAAGQIAPGSYEAPVRVTATDAAGNTSTAQDSVTIDTETTVTVNTHVEGDGIINQAEAADGVVLTGTGEPGADVSVDFAGITRTGRVDGAGNWQVAFQPGDIPAGETTAAVSVTATDAAGNQATTAGSIEVDRLVSLGLDGPVAVDDIVNAAEYGAGIRLSGTVDPGSSVTVSLAGVAHTAVVLGDGRWFTTYTPGEVPDGDYTAQITALATDAAGNRASISDSVRIDTHVEPLSIATVAGDDTINAAEQADGVTFTGRVEPGSSVDVSFEGTTHAAAVDAAGNWAVGFAAGEIPTGEYSADATVVATDHAGNIRTETAHVAVDTDNPDAPVILSFRQGGTGVREIGTAMNDDITQVQQIDDTGHVSPVSYDLEIDEVWGELIFDFNEAIPTGSHLVVTSTDAAGNQAGTLFVMEDPGNSVVDLTNPGLGQFDIQAVDLQFASEAELTVTADQLAGLSSFSNELTVHGGDDDIVMASAATATGETRVIEGQSYDVYTLGEGTLVIDHDIQVNPTLV